MEAIKRFMKGDLPNPGRLEERVTAGINLLLSGQLNHKKKEYKFGFGIGVGGP